MRRLSVVLCAALLVAIAGSGAGASGKRSLAAFTGAGTWISIYDTHAFRHPEAVVRRLHAAHIHTVFIETSNERQRRGVVHPVALARFLSAAHRARMAVVGWYLPSFVAPRADVRRALQGARFRAPSGDRFDAFALDIESTKIRSLQRRSSRATWVAREVRLRMPSRLALGAITIDPVGGRYWNGYPFRRLARSIDVFLPMEYFTFRTKGARGVAAYSSANVRRVRKLVGDPRFPVHPIGGDARAATLPELRAFLRASRPELGVSLWEYGETSPRQLAVLAASR